MTSLAESLGTHQPLDRKPPSASFDQRDNQTRRNRTLGGSRAWRLSPVLMVRLTMSLASSWPFFQTGTDAISLSSSTPEAPRRQSRDSPCRVSFTPVDQSISCSGLWEVGEGENP